MIRSVFSYACLCLLFLSLLASKSSEATLSHNGDECRSCKVYDITALIFTPGQPDALKTLLTRLQVISQADDDRGKGVYVIADANREALLTLLGEFGKTESRLRRKLPLLGDSPAAAFSMGPSGQYSAWLQVKYLQWINKEDTSVVLDFTLKTRFPGASVVNKLSDKPELIDISGQNFSNSGSVLFPARSALLSVDPTDSGYLIWIISDH